MYKKQTFKNKIRLILVPQKDTQSMTILFLFGVGSRYESKNINGASHFIEHLMFKGTKKRPTTLDISKELDRVGAEFNAMTSKDYTGYYIKINHEKSELAIDILSDMLLNSKFESKEINKERGVVIEEINMYHDNPLMHIESLLEESLYSGNSLGWDIAGPVSVIKKITRKQLVDYRDDYYRSDNAVIAIAGKINQKTLKLIKTRFIEKIKLPKNEMKKFSKFESKQKEPRIKIRYKDTKQVQLSLGFPAFSSTDPKKYALHLLSVILGGNMSSRLFVSVREKKGLAYFIRCYPNFYQDTGNLFIQSGLDVSRIDEAIKIILSELKSIKKKGVLAKELENAKEFIRGKFILSLEDSSHLAEFYAKQDLLTGEVLSPDQKINKYNAVTLSDVLNIAKEVFVKEKLNLAMIGPYKSADKFYKLINL